MLQFGDSRDFRLKKNTTNESVTLSEIMQTRVALFGVQRSDVSVGGPEVVVESGDSQRSKQIGQWVCV